MLAVDLKARTRTGRGRECRNRLKAKGLIPAVVYGREVGSQPIELENRDIENILKKGGRNALVALKVESGEGDARKIDAIIKDVQFHPYKNEIFHIDLHQISLKDELTTSVGLKLVGSPPGVTAGGRLEQLIRQVEVSCLPQNIPDHIEVDLSELKIGGSIHVADLKAPEGAKLVTDGEVAVVTVVAPRREEEEVSEEAEKEHPEASSAPENER
jgi:large subunit ribosomal protein L25